MTKECQGLRRVMAVAAMLFTGCTMCPSPFDYSGPVPNGSAPQNDFRARSNGIIPIGGSPKPWPPLVQREADEPTLATEPHHDDGVVQISGQSEARHIDPVTE